MSDIAIRVEGLSKCYRIGARQAKYKTFRESLGQALARPINVLRATVGPERQKRTDYETIWALNDVEFEVRQGEVMGIIGRNGAGKSTLLKILSRITDPTSGQAEIHGRVRALLEVGTGFHPELTGRENIQLNGAILGMKRAEIARKFDEIVAFSEVGQFIDTPVKRYSSGMYLRLAFAVAAHLEPEILIIDEVLAVGDAAFQRKCLGKIGEVASDGRTVLFVSHNMPAVENLCTRAILLSNGQVESEGEVHTTIAQYLWSQQNVAHASTNELASGADGQLRLLQVEPVDELGHSLLGVQIGRDMHLKVVFDAEHAYENVCVSLGINSIIEGRIAVLHSDIAGYKLSFVSGLNTVTCHVPALPLVAGAYLLDVKAYSKNVTVLWAPGISQLVIESANFFGTGKLPDPSWAGMFYLSQQWEVSETAPIETAK